MLFSIKYRILLSTCGPSIVVRFSTERPFEFNPFQNLSLFSPEITMIGVFYYCTKHTWLITSLSSGRVEKQVMGAGLEGFYLHLFEKSSILFALCVFSNYCL